MMVSDDLNSKFDSKPSSASIVLSTPTKYEFCCGINRPHVELVTKPAKHVRLGFAHVLLENVSKFYSYFQKLIKLVNMLALRM